MKTWTKLALASLSVAGITTTAPAFAQDAAAPAPTWALNGTLDVQSDYRFRGISQSDRNPVPQGALNLTGPDGWYVGTWMSQINWQVGKNENPGIEWDIYGGKHFDLGGTDLNVEAYEYAYPDYNTTYVAGKPAASYFEGIFTLTHAFGPVSIDAVYAVSPQFTLGTGTAHYLEGQTIITIADWLTVSANIGHQWVQTAPADYTHSDVGATATWKQFSLDARYVSTTIKKSDCAAFWMGTKNACGGGFVATLSYNFALMP